MSNYVKATNFATKDTLPTGDANKIVKGTEIDNEFNAIAGAISSKADIASPSFTGTPSAPTAVAGSNTTQIATTAYVKGEVEFERTTTTTVTNKTINVDSNTLSGIAANSFVVSNASGNIDGSATQKAIPAGAVVGTTDTQTLTNKSLTSPTLTGTPTAPTATAGTNTTQVATTAFVTSAVSTATGSLGTMSTQNANTVAITGGTITGTTINGNVVGTNAVGARTVSTSGPSGGSNGDIWYQV